MHYVYLLESQNEFGRFYVGLTNNLKRRFEEHNAGKSIHTNKYMPWRLRSYFDFCDIQKATDFELYLKSGSGRSFMKRHF